MLQDKPLFIVIICLGAFFSVIYMASVWIRGVGHPQFLNVAMIFGSSLGFVSGAKLCYMICCDSPAITVTNDDKLSICVGGLAICWVSVVGIIDAFRTRIKP